MRQVLAAAGMALFAVVSFVGACVTLGSAAMLWAGGSPLFALWWAVVAALVTALVGVLPAWGLWRWGFGARPLTGRDLPDGVLSSHSGPFDYAPPGHRDYGATDAEIQAYVDWAKGKQR